MDWTQQAMALARLGLPACTHRWRRVRTVGHPFKGELECENCYASESKTAPFLIEEAAL